MRVSQSWKTYGRPSVPLPRGCRGTQRCQPLASVSLKAKPSKKQDSPTIQPPFFSKQYVQTSTDRTSRSSWWFCQTTTPQESHSHVAPVPPRYPTSAVSRMAARSISWNLVATKGLSGYSICLILGGNWLVVLSLFMNVSYIYIYTCGLSCLITAKLGMRDRPQTEHHGTVPWEPQHFLFGDDGRTFFEDLP